MPAAEAPAHAVIAELWVASALPLRHNQLLDISRIVQREWDEEEVLLHACRLGFEGENEEEDVLVEV